MFLRSCITAALAPCLLTSACTGPVRYQRAVDTQPDRLVRLEARYGPEVYGRDGAGLPFDHPVALSERDWAGILKGIRVQLRKRLLSVGRSDITLKEAFTDAEREYLAEQFAAAFARARPDEWVLFYFEHSRAAGEAGQHPALSEFTSGGLFMTGARLHFVLANYRFAASMPFLAEQVRQDPLWPAGDAFYELAPGAHLAVRTLRPLGARPDLTKPLRAHLSEATLDYQALLASPGAVEAERAVRPPLRERLQTLEELRKEGYITEEEFQLKRHRLLEEL